MSRHLKLEHEESVRLKLNMEKARLKPNVNQVSLEAIGGEIWEFTEYESEPWNEAIGIETKPWNQDEAMGIETKL